MGQLLAEKLGLADEFIEYLYLFAPLHDIGKVGIPDSVLLKPGKLDALKCLSGAYTMCSYTSSLIKKMLVGAKSSCSFNISSRVHTVALGL